MAKAPAGGRPLEPYQELEHQLSLFARRARAVYGQVARAVHPELEPAAYGLLVRVAETGGARVTDLSTYFGVGKATISRQVRLLEQLGLVTREDDPEDARTARIVLTDDGRRRLIEVRDVRRERMRQLLQSWPERDIAQLAELLGRYNALYD